MPRRPPRLDPVTSLTDLYARARIHPEYAELAYDAAWTFGGDYRKVQTLDEAITWLRRHAEEAGGDEASVLAEVNRLLTLPPVQLHRR